MAELELRYGIFFAASVGLVQNDLKRVIAYSTCSQLGYMVFACGLSHYSVAFFHLANHAFFKALLFLTAGAIIHALADEQDMRKMGGLVKILPYSLDFKHNSKRCYAYFTAAPPCVGMNQREQKRNGCWLHCVMS